MSADLPRIALTLGEPAGIGPDIAVMMAQRAHPADITVVGDAHMLEARARILGLPLSLLPFDAPSAPQRRHRLKVWHVETPHAVRCGKPDPTQAGYVLETLRIAVRGCLEGTFDAMVTAPIHKGVICQAGIPFTGHTEYLAELTGSPRPVMMLATERLRVALATTHLPLGQVPQAITRPGLEAVLRVLHSDLQRRFRIPSPRILVCGLNPHAGEEGHLGREEIEVITPVIEKLKGEGMALQGPLPADTLFVPEQLSRGDAVLAMYHDQGLPVLKHQGFGEAVNITLGLPILRTSVDHGTALELAGTGRARATSLEAALAMAITLA